MPRILRSGDADDRERPRAASAAAVVAPSSNDGQQHAVGDLADDVGAGHGHRAVEAAGGDGEGEHARLLAGSPARHGGARAARTASRRRATVLLAGRSDGGGSDATRSLGLLTDVARTGVRVAPLGNLRTVTAVFPSAAAASAPRSPTCSTSSAPTPRPAARAGRPRTWPRTSSSATGGPTRWPGYGAGGCRLGGPLAAWAHRLEDRLRADDAVRRGRRPGAVRAARLVAAGLRRCSTRLLNTAEFAIHHEDVRRAQPGWAPRALPRADQDAALAAAALYARRRRPAGRGARAAADRRPRRRSSGSAAGPAGTVDGRAAGAAALGRRPPRRRPRRRSPSEPRPRARSSAERVVGLAAHGHAGGGEARP